MATETVGTGAETGTQTSYSVVDTSSQATTDPQASGSEETCDSTGTMPPVNNVDPNGYH
jgi:hypothetical protein